MTTSSLQNTYSIDSSDITTITIDSGLSSSTSGSYLTTSSIGTSYTWTHPPYVMQTSNGEEVAKVAADEATLEVTGRIRINGEYLDERLERIETLLNIPTRDVTIEEQYPKLKALFKEYMQELEKYKTWNRLTKGNEK